MSSVMSAKEASVQYFGGKVSYWKLLAMAKEGIIPHSRVGERVFFRTESLDAWLAEQEQENTAKPRQH